MFDLSFFFIIIIIINFNKHRMYRRIRCEKIRLAIIIKEVNAPPEVEVLVYNQNNSATHYDDCFQKRLD